MNNRSNTIPVKLLDGMSPAEIAFRQGIPAHLMQALQAGALTDKTIQQVVLMPDGKTSVVYNLVADDGTALILKIVEDAAWLRAEAIFLQTWYSLGVRTPNVYRRGSLTLDGEVPFLLMEYVEGQNLLELLETEQLSAPSVLNDLGVIQATMHQAKAQGFGRVVWRGDTLRGEHNSFSDEMTSGKFGDTLQFGFDHDLLHDQDRAVVEAAIEKIDRHVATIGPSLVHTDFRAGNVLYDVTRSNPYAIIDPSPMITHPYMCLAYTLILEEIHGKRKPTPILIGYERVTPVEQSVLVAAILLTALRLLVQWTDTSYAANLLRVYTETRAVLKQ